MTSTWYFSRERIHYHRIQYSNYSYFITWRLPEIIQMRETCFLLLYLISCPGFITWISFNFPLVNNGIYCIFKGAGRVIQDLEQTLEFIPMFSIRLHRLKTAAMSGHCPVQPSTQSTVNSSQAGLGFGWACNTNILWRLPWTIQLWLMFLIRTVTWTKSK